jgi:hypothetical protein
MLLQVGEWVRTDTGIEGKVVLISANRITAFVEIQSAGKENIIKNYLLSSLTRIERPTKEGDSD